MFSQYLRFYCWKNNVIKANTSFDIEGNFKYFGSALKNKYCIHEKTDIRRDYIREMSANIRFRILYLWFSV